MRSHAQSSMEFLFLSAVVITLIIPTLYFALGEIDVVRERQISEGAETVRNAINTLIELGVGSQTREIITIPSGVTNYVFINGNILSIEFMNQNITIIFPLPIMGSWPITEGIHHLNLYNAGDYIILTVCGNDNAEAFEQCDGTDPGICKPSSPICIPPGEENECTCYCNTPADCPTGYECIGNSCQPPNVCAPPALFVNGNCCTDLDGDGYNREAAGCGLWDCDDNPATGGSIHPPPPPEIICDDNKDNDCDNLIDCEDGDCSALPTCVDCGDGECSPSETCDSCYEDCKLSLDCCGDSSTQILFEECDDGNLFDNDRCTNSCLSTYCGDGTANNDPPGSPVEECDDMDDATCIIGCNLDCTCDGGACATPPSNLVGWWRGEDDATDSSPSANNGIVSGTLTYTDGYVGRAFNFDGDDKITLQNDFTPSNFSIEAWVYPRQLARTPIVDRYRYYLQLHQRIIDNEFKAMLFIRRDDIADNVILNSTKLSADAWWHVVGVVKDQDYMEIYINGELNATADITGISLNQNYGNSYPVTIGYTVLGDMYSDARIDEVSLYDRALTAAEVQGLYNAGVYGKCSGAGAACGDGIVGGTNQCESEPTCPGDCEYGCNLGNICTVDVVTQVDHCDIAAYQSSLTTNAKFNSANDIEFDNDGNLYIADMANNCMRKIYSNALVARYAGTCDSVSGFGSNNGQALSARFYRPASLAFDSNGNLWIADYDNDVVRMIDTNGIVTTIGSGVQGDYSGSATTARFYNPISIEYDQVNNNLYVGDYNRLIRKIDLDLPTTDSNFVTTIVGLSGQNGWLDGGVGTATLGLVFGMALKNNVIYFTEYNNNIIRKFDLSTQIVTTIAGTGGTSGSADGTGPNARFYRPIGIAIDSSNNLWVADSHNQESGIKGKVRKIDLTNTVSTPTITVTGGIATPRGLSILGTKMYVTTAEIDIAPQQRVIEIDMPTLTAGSIFGQMALGGFADDVDSDWLCDSCQCWSGVASTYCGDGSLQRPNQEVPPIDEECDNGGLCTGDGSTVCTSDADCSIVGGTCLARNGDGCSSACIIENSHFNNILPNPAFPGQTITFDFTTAATNYLQALNAQFGLFNPTMTVCDWQGCGVSPFTLCDNVEICTFIIAGGVRSCSKAAPTAEGSMGYYGCIWTKSESETVVVEACGNGACEPGYGEDYITCSADCACVPDCTGLECGQDPICGTSCGTCSGGLNCISGHCSGGTGWCPDGTCNPPGETCDNCYLDCVAVCCGDGTVQTGFEECEQDTDCPDIAGYTKSCIGCECSYSPIGECGNEVLDPGEECDPPSGVCPKGEICNLLSCLCEAQEP